MSHLQLTKAPNKLKQKQGKRKQQQLSRLSRRRSRRRSGLTESDVIIQAEDV